MDDEERGKMFVGGLSWDTTQEDLSRYFYRFGDIIDCVVMKNSSSGRSRGFGFVKFKDPANVYRVLQTGPHRIDGRTIDPKPCNPRSLQKPQKREGYKVFLGGLPPNITETELHNYFNRYGEIIEIAIMYDQERKMARGFGFLSFEEEYSVEHVTSERFINLNGKQVEIKRAEPRIIYDDQNTNNNSVYGANEEWGPQNAQMNEEPYNMPDYIDWDNSPPQQQGNGYGWGTPPSSQCPPAPDWPDYAGAQQIQGYGRSDMYNSNSTGGPYGSYGGGSWNPFYMPSNSAEPTGAYGGGAGTAADMYSSGPTWAAGEPSTTGPAGGMPRTGPGNSASKSGSEYDYGDYAYGYDYDDNGNYPEEEPGESGYGAEPRSGYGDDS